MSATMLLGIYAARNARPPGLIVIPYPDTYEDIVAGADTVSDLVLWLKLGEAVDASTAADTQSALTPFTVNSGVTFGEPGLPPLMDTTWALFDGTSGYLSHAHDTDLELAAGTFIVLLKPAASCKPWRILERSYGPQ